MKIRLRCPTYEAILEVGDLPALRKAINIAWPAMQARCARSSPVQLDLWDPIGPTGQGEWVQIPHPEEVRLPLLSDWRGLIDSSLWDWLVKMERNHRKLRVVGEKRR